MFRYAPIDEPGSAGRSKGCVTADNDGLFWRSRRLPQVATGEYVCSVGTDVDTF